MNSPFPGMDPFLERHWTGVHASLIVYAMDQIQPQLPAALWARAGERVIVESEEGRFQRAIYPDVHVAEGRAGSHEATGGVAVAAGPAIAEPLRQRTIDIIDVETGDRIITCIEFLSPTNKRSGDGRKQYRKKQQECVEADVNLVEIDLTRTGDRRFLVPMELIPRSHRTTYQACVWRATWPTRYEVYAMPLESPLPAIRIPLRADDNDVVLDLHALIDQVYVRGRYDHTDYNSPPDPPLTTQEAAWVEQLLRENR